VVGIGEALDAIRNFVVKGGGRELELDGGRIYKYSDEVIITLGKL
jgi:hypothetical protein